MIVLGAGASLAAFHHGDARGNRLPLMSNVVKILELRDVIEQAGHAPTASFESLCSQLYALDLKSDVVKETERRVEES